MLVAAASAAAIAALALACGVNVAAPHAATPGASPAVVSTAPPTVTAAPAVVLPTVLPGTTATDVSSPAPTPTATPGLPTPLPSASAGPGGASSAAEEAAAARRASAAAAVRAILPEYYVEAQDMFARSGVPGAAVAVVAGDTALFVDCFGVRQVGAPDKVDIHTVFQLAGVSQSFTATMLAALVSAREMGWDDPVQKYWPGFALWDPWVSGSVTFTDLMADRTGLPAYAGDELVQFGYGRAEIERRLRYLPPAAGFRTAYAGQEALPTAAAMAAARATGETWDKLVSSRVLQPLGMDETILTYRGYVDAPDRSGSHVSVNGVMQPQTPEDDSVFAPAGQVSSSIADLVPYVRMQLNGGALAGTRVAGEAELAATHAAITVVGDGDAGPVACAMGWQTLDYLGRRVVEQDGGFAAGTSAVISMVPDDGVGIVVLANAYPEGNALAVALTRTLYDLYLRGAPQQDWLAEQLAAPATAPQAPGLGAYQQLPAQASLGAAPPRARSAYTGVYTNTYYGRVTVSAGPGSGLDVKLGRGDTLRFVPYDGDTWRQPDTDTAAEFKVAGGRAASVRLSLLDFDGRDGLFLRQ